MPSNPFSRRALLAAAPGLVLGGLSAADAQVTGLLFKPEAETPPTEAELQLDAWTDTYGRPTAKVMLNGKGPFRFLVDTGSTTTVIAARHVASVAAPLVGTAIVNGTTGTAEMPLASIARLETGVVAKDSVRVAVLTDAGLAREDGILGADIFAGRKLSFDIQEKTVKVETSRRSIRGAPVPNLRVRNGLLAEIDGEVGTIRTRLMLDTGAQHCIANMPLKRTLERAYPRSRRATRIKVIGVTGHVIVGDYFDLPTVNFRKFKVEDAGVVATDAPIFRVWGLDNAPAMIVGVNLLSRLAGFSIDYGARVFDAELLAAAIARNGTMLG